MQKRVSDLERDFQIALLPPDENENRDAIIEIRAGTGGSEWIECPLAEGDRIEFVRVVAGG